MKRQRGLKRYYRNLAIQIDFEKPTWKIYFNDPNAWFDDWHWHFDWKGFGNDSFKRRKPHLDKLFRHFDLLVEKTKKINSDFQLYTVLLDFHSSSDALFLHKPNSNNSQFPFKIEDLSKTTTLTNKALDEYIEKLSGYERLYGQAGQAFCLLYKRNVGQPFQ
ncbi:hypothetical protein [Mucilaginibacter arboris]|uniref:Uncharacterized protein n=1 Tax=Mucilaginibacter arboris TaxID=2682090 RepID=A0A7K1T1T2_9SPHI|nr:hypothetical protein [Mucilaginibacter arboris]MVN23514.1 hypothetical protein [Mucilaginibacter arboris]